MKEQPRGGRWRRAWNKLSRIFQGPSPEPDDPYACVGAPKKPRPPLRSSSVAVDPES